jgi:DNA-binding FrmR family transcriptional regulator
VRRGFAVKYLYGIDKYPEGVYNYNKKTIFGDSMENGKCPTCHERKVRDAEERQALLNRLRRIEGQVRGVAGMVERDAYCVDILTQVQAISSALTSFSTALLDSHLKTCVRDDILDGRDEVLDELVGVISRFMK